MRNFAALSPIICIATAIFSRQFLLVHFMVAKMVKISREVIHTTGTFSPYNSNWSPVSRTLVVRYSVKFIYLLVLFLAARQIDRYRHQSGTDQPDLCRLHWMACHKISGPYTNIGAGFGLSELLLAESALFACRII